MLELELLTCDCFIHMVEPHQHLCSHQSNITGRCGFSRNEVLSGLCPLCTRLVKAKVMMTDKQSSTTFGTGQDMDINSRLPYFTTRGC